MTTAALHPFLRAAEGDLALFGLARLPAAHFRWWLKLVLGVVVYPLFLLLAQFVPFVFRKHLGLLIPSLPHVTSSADLAWIKDVLVLYHASLKEYAPYSLFRRQAQDVLDEIDEQIDSLQFIADNKEFLDEAVGGIEQR